MPATLKHALIRKRIRDAESARRRQEEWEKRKIGSRNVCRTEHYITLLSTGSFRLNIHWQSSKSHLHQRDSRGTCATENLSFTILKSFSSFPSSSRKNRTSASHSYRSVTQKLQLSNSHLMLIYCSYNLIILNMSRQ